MDIVTLIQQHGMPVIWGLAVIGALDLILGVIAKHTDWPWADNAYAIVHEIITKLITRKP